MHKIVSRQCFQKVLICDTRGHEIASYLASRRTDLVCRVRTAATVTAEDRMWAEVLISFTVPVDLARSSIRWVHSTGAGVDGLLFQRSWPAGVTLTRTIGELGERVAEYCVGHALALTQRILLFRADQDKRRWAPVEPATLRGSTAVIVGTGSVGSMIAAQFSALGCATVGVSRRGQSKHQFDRVYAVGDLVTIVPTAQWIILAVPLTPESHRLVDADLLNRCQAAVLINVSRGGLLDTTALLAALKSKKLLSAILDVFDTEPLPAHSPLWQVPNVLITPHIAAVTHVAEVGEAFLEALTKFEAGESTPLLVDTARGY